MDVLHTHSGNGGSWAKLVIGALIGTVILGLVSWMAWVTINVANYVSGERRGERLSTVEAELMIERSDEQLRREFDARLKVQDK